MTSRQLEDLYNTISAKLYRLNIAKTIETDAAVKFKLDYQIAETNAELKNVEDQLDGRTKQHLANPYRGLSAFREQDEPFFFGRDGYVEQIHQAVLNQPFTAILGASGSGKSSIIYAGLMPRLRRTPRSQGGSWLIANFRPGQEADRHDPFIALSETLTPLLHPELHNDRIELRKRINNMAAGFKDNAFSLLQIVSDILRAADEDRLLLFADQFEELYTLCADEPERHAFLEVLLQAIRNASAAQNFRFILTMRADFLNKAITYRPLADVLNPNSSFEGSQGDVPFPSDERQPQPTPKSPPKRGLNNPIIILGPMNPDELRDCITRPAQRAEIRLAAGLTQRILDDVAAAPGHLPLLEFALTRLWEEQTDNGLTHAAYEAIGGVEKALADQANHVFDHLSAIEQECARRIFIQLVQPGAGTEDTRRLASREDIGDIPWDLVTKLADKRLIVTGGSKDGGETIEIVHEALLRHWHRLNDWMQADRAFRTWQERLRASLKQWQELNRDESALLRGALLAEGQEWLTQRPNDITATEKAYLQAAIDARDRELLAEQERQAKMLQLEQDKAQQAEEGLRKQKTLRNFIMGAAAIAVLVAILAGVQWIKAQRALDDVITANRVRIKTVLDVTAVDLLEQGRYADVLPILDEAAELGVQPERIRLEYANIAFIYSHRPDYAAKAVEIIKRPLVRGESGLDLSGFSGQALDGDAIRAAIRDVLGADVYQRELMDKYFPQMIAVPGGEYMMGLQEDDPYAKYFQQGEFRETPAHKVTVPAFQMGKYPVIGYQYRLFYFCQVDGDDPPNKGQTQPLTAPVTHVDWYDAVKYCAWLNTQLTNLGKVSEPSPGYRLPSEAEWEYAARSGGKNEFWAGTRDGGTLKDYAWYVDNSDSHIQPVGLLKPNGLGLYDMSGNVFEWCADHWQQGYDGAPTDGSARINSVDDTLRLLRGGAFSGNAPNCRVASRSGDNAVDRNGSVGFRVSFCAART